MKRWTLAVAIVVASGARAYAEPAMTIEGDYWTEERDAIARIYREGGRYFGRLIWTEEADAKDDENPDAALRERPLVGLVFLTDFHFDGGSKWTGGKVYAPDDGKTYSGYMKMKDPNVLELRGYVGISLFGRTARWPRVARDEYPEGLEAPAP
jgi:uncharacterized protein (DUF2147 family)